MKWVYFILFFITITLFAKAQYNLVPNPSFEIYSSCPNGSGQLSRAIPWTGPNNDDADLYNICSSQTNINNQIPINGIGYAGFYAYNGVNNNYRENIHIQLLGSLLLNKCYFVKFHVSLATPLKYAVNNIGLCFTNYHISNNGFGEVLNLPQNIIKFGNPVISDTLNWVEISGIYNSNGNESYITVGNFKKDSLTDTLVINNNWYFGSYYFLDDVSVTPIDSIPGGMNANAGSDKSIAIGDSVFIGQEISNLNCNWYVLGGSQIANNTSGIYVKPNSPTTYVVEQNLCGSISYDTVNVLVSPTGLKHYNELQQNVKLFPNPNNGNFTLQVDDKLWQHVTVNVIDVIGNEIYNSTLFVKEGLVKFNLDVKAGTYFVIIFNAHTNEKIIKKLIIQ